MTITYRNDQNLPPIIKIESFNNDFAGIYEFNLYCEADTFKSKTSIEIELIKALKNYYFPEFKTPIPVITIYELEEFTYKIPKYFD